MSLRFDIACAHFLWRDINSRALINCSRSVCPCVSKEDTILESFPSYDRAYPSSQVYSTFKKYDVKFLWNAVETEKNLKDSPCPCVSKEDTILESFPGNPNGSA
jgi:ferredoxin-thioredoxin reductase catalytic subunit